MKVLIIGLGSIAKKHIKALQDCDPEIQIAALRSSKDASVENGVVNIFEWPQENEKPDFILVSNPTNLHKDAILKAAKFGCPLLIEKPVLADSADGEGILLLLQQNKLLTYVACNLRFHPCIVFLKNYLHKENIRVNEVNVYCGSDLSQWRPGKDYRNSYSASKQMGGGVHLDLIHELDYSYWLFGKPGETISLKRKTSSLEITSTDFAAYHLCYPDFTVNIILNYYRKKTKRSIEIVSEQGTFYTDLLGATITKDENEIFSSPDFKMEQTYYDQMKYFVTHIKKNKAMMNDVGEALEVLKIATTDAFTK